MSTSNVFSQDSVTRFKKRKARFTFSEVHILLDEVRKNRHIVVGKFNRGVPTDIKKRKWAEITARVNEIGEYQREVIEIIKKWSDLKCDTKRKVAAMRLGVTAYKGIQRLSRELSPMEDIVHKILELDNKRGLPPGDAYRPLGDDNEGPEEEEEEEEEEEDMVGIHGSPNGGMDMTSMPPPPPHSLGMPMSAPLPMGMPIPGPGQMPPLPSQHKDNHSMPTYSGASSRELSQLSYEMQYEIPTTEDAQPQFLASDDDHGDDLPPQPQPSSGLPENHQGGGSAHRPSTAPHHHRPSPPPLSAPPPPASQQHAQSARDSMLQSASLSVQEQRATNVLMETVSRSLELLSESVQQLAETQQEFVRESLQLQRETVNVLRDFASGALSLMHDKLNGRPALGRAGGGGMGRAEVTVC